MCRQTPGLEFWFWHKLCDLGSVTQPLRVSDSSSTKMEIILYFGRVIGLPRWYSGEESACQCRRCKRLGFSPRVGKIPCRRKWQPSPLFLPGKLHGQRSLVGYCPWGRKVSKWLSDWAQYMVTKSGTIQPNRAYDLEPVILLLWLSFSIYLLSVSCGPGPVAGSKKYHIRGRHLNTYNNMLTAFL